MTIALDIALLLTASGQAIYHTSPGPVGEIMINLRKETKSAEFLIYPNDRRKVVCIGPNETPQQGSLMPDSLRETLQWLNQPSPQSLRPQLVFQRLQRTKPPGQRARPFVFADYGENR